MAIATGRHANFDEIPVIEIGALGQGDVDENRVMSMRNPLSHLYAELVKRLAFSIFQITAYLWT
jgi:hypothetical protein